METVNDWDTWNWKLNNNLTAQKLNFLFNILGEDEFTEYILQLFEGDKIIDSENKLFTNKMYTMLETYDRLLNQQVDSCERSMYIMNLWIETAVYNECYNKFKSNVNYFKTGVVFVNNNLSEIGDKLLDIHPELDILLMVAFPGGLSWRTSKQLPVSLAKVAKLATGMGGGHSCAAGSSIPFSKFQDMFTRFMEENFDKSMDYSNFLSLSLIRKRAEFEQLKQTEWDNLD